MKIAQYIAKRLADEGITQVFLVQGAANNDLIYAIADQEGIDYVCPMHEQAAGFMAEGWSKVTGRPGVAIATSGPGGQNLVTCIANAYYDSVPMLFITGQVNSRFMRKNEELRQVGFQEWPIVDCVKQITKMAMCVGTPEEFVSAFEKAWETCQTGRPGPVLLDLPIDVQRAELNSVPWLPHEATNVVSGRAMPLFPEVSLEQQVASVVGSLHRAKRPVMLIGGGCGSTEARKLLLQIGESWGVPMIPTWNALDIVPSNSPWYGGQVGTYGGAGRNFAVQNSDFLLAVGCRISGRITGGVPSTFARGAYKVYVDIDENLMKRENQAVPANLNIHASAEDFLKEAIKSNVELLPAWPDWWKSVSMWQNKYHPLVGHNREAPDPYLFADILSYEVEDTAIIVTDCGGNIVTMNHAFSVVQGQRYFTNNGNSPMGYSFCAALGACFAPEAEGREVICVIGDGGFNMNIQELQLIKNYGVTLKTFILDNRSYGITKAFQGRTYGNRYEASGPSGYNPPEFKDIVHAYGIDTFTIRLPEHPVDVIRNVIQQVLHHDASVVCIVECPDWHDYKPAIVAWDAPIEDQWPYLPRDEFKANMIIDPVPGWENRK